MNSRPIIAACIMACLSVGTLIAQPRSSYEQRREQMPPHEQRRLQMPPRERRPEQTPPPAPRPPHAPRPRVYDEDLGLTVGINVPMYGGMGSDVTLGVTYGQFHYNGIGFRTGFQYTPSVADVDNSFGIPIAFAYRTGSRSRHDKLNSGMYGAASYAYSDIYYYGEVSPGGVIASFLMNLINDVEFDVGITPGYVAGGSSSVGTSLNSDGDYVDHWTDLNNHFSLSLDAGAALNYSIWRFDLKIMPAFHYLLTNNYVSQKVRGNTYASGTFESSQPIRWFFTLSGGLAFRF